MKSAINHAQSNPKNSKIRSERSGPTGTVSLAEAFVRSANTDLHFKPIPLVLSIASCMLHPNLHAHVALVALWWPVEGFTSVDWVVLPWGVDV